jgi:hypothetical protein
VPVTGEEVAEAELRAAWEGAAEVIALPPQPRTFEPVAPLGETEQLGLFAA